MYLYLRNKNVPGFMYLTCVLVPLSGHFFETAAKRAVRYVKRCRTESAQKVRIFMRPGCYFEISM